MVKLLTQVDEDTILEIGSALIEALANSELSTAAGKKASLYKFRTMIEIREIFKVFVAVM